MGDMKFPCVKRIRALIEMLKEKEKEEISQLDKTLPSVNAVKDTVDKEFGLDKILKEIEEIEDRLTILSAQSRKLCGDYFVVTEKRDYYPAYRDAYDKRKGELEYELRGRHIEVIKDEYKRKEASLWLCETAEEAREIVGI